MPSTGLLPASGGANVNDGGSTAWATPGNIFAVDGARATCFRTSTGTSQLLHATFTLAGVPDGATIDGIVVRVHRDYSSSSPPVSVRDHTVRLTKDGTNMVGDNLADTATDWQHQVGIDVDYGGSGSLWGTTLTVAEVKAAQFGVMFKASHGVGTSISPRVDAIWIDVYYTEIDVQTSALPPDAILASTNLSGAVAAVQDDPDSPDGNWLTATSATAATDVRVSFPAPGA